MDSHTAIFPRLKERVAIVTGGASGIGRSICLAYAHEGAKIVVADLQPESRNPEEAETPTHELIKSTGGVAEFHVVDVSKPDSVIDLVRHAVTLWGRLDIMVNNAGISVEASTGTKMPVWEYPDAAWDRTMSINCSGVFYGVRAAAAQMVKQTPLPTGDRGWIVNLSSVFGLVGTPAASGYVASKHAVMGLTRAAALDLAPHMVHCNAICPGYVKSAFTESVLANSAVAEYAASLHPLRGIGNPQDISRVAVFLASDDARWVSGIGLPCDGGYTAQ